MIPVRVHIQNMEGDGIDYNSVSTVVNFPAVPRIGETVFLDNEYHKRIIRKLLDQIHVLNILETYRNIIVHRFDERPFLSLQGFCLVKDVRYEINDDEEKSEIHLLLAGLDGNYGGEYYEGPINQQLIVDLEISFQEEKMFF